VLFELFAASDSIAIEEREEDPLGHSELHTQTHRSIEKTGIQHGLSLALINYNSLSPRIIPS
jgi:hypothetical protein